MAEQVMKNIWLFQIIELVATANEIPRGKFAVHEHIEKCLALDQSRSRHHFPTCQGTQTLVHFMKVGDLCRIESKCLVRLKICRTGTRRKHF